MSSKNVRVQPDWDLCKPGESFWLNYRPSPALNYLSWSPSAASDTIYAQVTVNTDKSFQVTPSTIKVRRIRSGVLQVTVDAFEFCVVSPSSTDAKSKGKRIEHLDLSAQGGLLARTNQDGHVGIYSTDETQKGSPPIRLLSGAHVGDVYFCKFFSSGKVRIVPAADTVVLTGGADTTLRIWDLQDFDGTPDALIKGHQGAVTCADFVDRGRNIVSGSKDGTGRLWDVPTQTMIHKFEGPDGPVNAIALLTDCTSAPMEKTPSRDERDFGTESKVMIVGSEDKGIHVYDLRQRTRLSHLPTSSAVNAVVATSTQSLFMAGCGDGSLYAWDMKMLRSSNTAQPTYTRQREPSAVTALCMSPAAAPAPTVIACHGDGAAYTWNVMDTTAATTSPNKEFCGPDYDPLFTATTGVINGTPVLITGGRDGILRTYRLD